MALYYRRAVTLAHGIIAQGVTFGRRGWGGGQTFIEDRVATASGPEVSRRGYLNRRFSRESCPTVVQPINFIPRSISALIKPSARSTPAWPAAARG